MKDRKKLFICEIIVSAVLIVTFVIGLFLPIHFKPGTTPGEARLLIIYIKAVLVLAIGGMGLVISDRAIKLKNPVRDYPFLVHYDDGK